MVNGWAIAADQDEGGGQRTTRRTQIPVHLACMRHVLIHNAAFHFYHFSAFEL